jgi:hypothetical protein
MSKDKAFIQISQGMHELAAKHAQKIGWQRGAEAFLKCLCCLQGCHYNKHPQSKSEFWKEFWELVEARGVNPQSVQEIMEQKLREKPWTTVMPYSPKDVLDWIGEKIRPDQP